MIQIQKEIRYRCEEICSILSKVRHLKFIFVQRYIYPNSNIPVLLIPSNVNFAGASEGGREAIESISIRLFGDKYFPTYKQVR